MRVAFLSTTRFAVAITACTYSICLKALRSCCCGVKSKTTPCQFPRPPFQEQFKNPEAVPKCDGLFNLLARALVSLAAPLFKVFFAGKMDKRGLREVAIRPSALEVVVGLMVEMLDGHIYIYRYIYMYTCTYTQACTHLCMNIENILCIYTYIYICIKTK